MVDLISAQKKFPGIGSQSRAQALKQATVVLDLAARAGRRLEESLNEGLDAAGLSAAQGRALRAIAADPGLAVGDLTDRLGISKQSLAPVLKSLTARGYVAVGGAPTDRRVRLLRLTRKGEAAWDAAARGALDLLAAASAQIGPGSAGGFRAMLQHLAKPPEDGKSPARNGGDVP